MIQLAIKMSLNDQESMNLKDVSGGPITTNPASTTNDLSKSKNSVQFMQIQASKINQLRKCLLDKFCQNIESTVLDSFSRQDKSVSEKTGLRLVAFFQCLLNLLSDLTAQDENDKKLLDNIIQNLLNILKSFKILANNLTGLDDSESIANSVSSNKHNNAVATPIYVRNESHELQLVIRLFFC